VLYAVNQVSGLFGFVRRNHGRVPSRQEHSYDAGELRPGKVRGVNTRNRRTSARCPLNLIHVPSVLQLPGHRYFSKAGESTTKGAHSRQHSLPQKRPIIVPCLPAVPMSRLEIRSPCRVESRE